MTVTSFYAFTFCFCLCTVFCLFFEVQISVSTLTYTFVERLTVTLTYIGYLLYNMLIRIILWVLQYNNLTTMMITNIILKSDVL